MARNTQRTQGRTINRARSSAAAPAPVAPVVPTAPLQPQAAEAPVNRIEAEILDLEAQREGKTEETKQGLARNRFNFVRRAVVRDYEKDAQQASAAAETAKRKNILLSSATQTLAEVQDRLNDVNATEKEITALSGRAARYLYEGMTSSVISLEEMTARMGDVFGFRKKGDAKIRVPAGDKEASKTPFGRGEEIRKRVIRLAKATEFVADGKGDRFFSDVPEDKQPAFRSEVQGILGKLDTAEQPEGLEGDELEAWKANQEANRLSPFTAYEMLADARKRALEGRSTLHFAYDPKRIMALVEELRAPDAGDKLDSNKALAEAYELLGEALFELAERPLPEMPEGEGEGE